MTCKKRSYLEPRVVVTRTEYEEDILQGSEIKMQVEVKDLEEFYYDGTEETSDYLIEF